MGGEVTAKGKDWRRWLVLAALWAGCEGRDSSPDSSDSGKAELADSSADSDTTSTPALDAAPSADGGADAIADAATATPADAAADASADAVADSLGTTAVDAADSGDAVADSPADAAIDATPTYPSATAGGDFPVELGGSSDDGVAIQPWTAAGQPVPLIFGPQGGYHIWVSICGPAALGAKAGLKILAKLPDGSQVDPGVTELTSKLAAVPGKTGQVCRVAAPAFVTCACEIHGAPLRVRVDVTDLSAAPGATPAKVGWAEKTVVPQHKLGPCWTKGSAPCAARRGPK